MPVVILSSIGQHNRTAPNITATLVKPVKPSALHDALADALAADRRRRDAGRGDARAPAECDAADGVDPACGSCSPRTTP